MTWHPTTNRIQTQHLKPEERAALEAWPHGVEYFAFGSWNNVDSPGWFRDTVYRGKPAPVVTSVWFNIFIYAVSPPYKSREEANSDRASEFRTAVLRNDTCNGVTTAHLEGLK